MEVPGWSPMALASLLYVWQAYACFKSGQIGLAMAFWGYTFANLGLIVAFIKGSTL
jgi:hypothetical protein